MSKKWAQVRNVVKESKKNAIFSPPPGDISATPWKKS